MEAGMVNGRCNHCSNNILLIFLNNHLVKAPGICPIHQFLPKAIVFKQPGDRKSVV
jgi:hypothetical protein